MSSLDNLIDQENRHLGGGPLGRRTKFVEAEPTRLRPALGEISQNQRRQPLRNTSNKPQVNYNVCLTFRSISRYNGVCPIERFLDLPPPPYHLDLICITWI